MDIDFDLSSFGESRKEVSSINRLQHAWISERAAPDILPYESRLLEKISTRLKEQVIHIEVLCVDDRLRGSRRSCCLNGILNGLSGLLLYRLKWNG